MENRGPPSGDSRAQQAGTLELKELGTIGQGASNTDNVRPVTTCQTECCPPGCGSRPPGGVLSRGGNGTAAFSTACFSAARDPWLCAYAHVNSAPNRKICDE